MIAFTLDRSKKWFRKDWVCSYSEETKSLYIYFDNKIGVWVLNKVWNDGGPLNTKQLDYWFHLSATSHDLAADDWQEFT